MLGALVACGSVSDGGTILASFDHPLDLFVDDDSAYLSTDAVMRFELDGGATATFTSGFATAMDDDALYLSNRVRVPKDGGVQATLASDSGSLLAVDDTFAYVVRDEIARVPKAGGGAEEVILAAAPGIGVEAVVVDDTHLYWSNFVFDGTGVPPLAASIMRIPKSGGDPEVLSTNAWSHTALTAQGGGVFWCESPSGVDSIVRLDTITKSAMVATTGVNACASPTIVVDGNDVYWSDSVDVFRATLGSGSTMIAHGGGAEIDSLAVHGGAVYWLEWEGATFQSAGALHMLRL